MITLNALQCQRQTLKKNIFSLFYIFVSYLINFNRFAVILQIFLKVWATLNFLSEQLDFEHYFTEFKNHF